MKGHLLKDFLILFAIYKYSENLYRIYGEIMGFFDKLRKPNVMDLYRKRDLNGLIKALKYQEDFVVRKEAVEALRAINDYGTVPALLDSLYDEHPVVRWAAVVTTGDIGKGCFFSSQEPVKKIGKDCHDALLKIVMSDPEVHVRHRAACSLAENFNISVSYLDDKGKAVFISSSQASNNT